MKNLKKVLSLILCFGMLMMFAACEKSQPKDPEEAAKQVIDDFVDAYTDGDFKKAATYTNGSSNYDDFDEFAEDKVDEFNQELNGIEEAFVMDELEDGLYDILKKALKKVDIEIEDIEVEDDEIIITANAVMLFGEDDSSEPLFNSSVKNRIKQEINAYEEAGRLEEYQKANNEAIIELYEKALGSVQESEVEIVLVKKSGKWVIDLGESNPAPKVFED